MSNPYVGEIRMFAGNFAPLGWALCDGAVKAISDFDTLFTLIGTTYGGDGESTFALPDLNGRTPIHQGRAPEGDTHVIGELGGEASVTLSIPQLPAHTHPALASSTGGTTAQANSGVWAAWADSPYAADVPTTTISPKTVVPVGGSLAHENRPPYLAVNYIISMYGIFPSQG